MINTVFHFVNDPTFNYAAAVANGDISEYTIVFNAADRSIRAKNTMFGRMSRADIVETLGDISDIIPAATSTKMGGIKIGYTSNELGGNKTYPVMLDENNRAYVDVPWTDTVTAQYDDSALQAEINAQRNRIDNYISDLTDYVQDLTEALLVDAQWVTDNLAEGEIGRQIKDWTDLYMRQYGVWEWKDENDHSKGRWIKTSVLEQTADRIEARVGEVDSENKAAISDLELSVNGKYVVEMQQSGDTNTATNINTISIKIAKPSFIITNGMELNEKDFTNVPLQDRVYYKTTDSTTQYFKLVRVDGVVESNATLTAAYDEYTTNNDGNLDKLVKMAASQLQLKTSKNGSNIESVSDLASVITSDGHGGYSFTGYSGLNNTVSDQGNSITAQNSLMSRVVASTDPNDTDNYGKPNSAFKTNVIAGLATEAYVDGSVASASSTLSSSIGDVSAAVTTKVSKSDGKIESGVTIQADHVLIDSNVTVSGKLSAMSADITNLQSQDITIKNTADNANSEIIRLTNGNGTFSGNVVAKTLIAGDPTGINIKTSQDKIEFCQGIDTRAYFVADNKGMQLHVWDADGKEYVIDFTKWSQVGGSTYTPVRHYLKYNNGNTSTPFVQDNDIFKGSDGKYYSYNGSSYTLIANRDCYIREPANSYPTSGTGFNGQYVPVIYAYSSNNSTPVAIGVTVDRYIKYTISNGVIGGAATGYIYHCTDYPISVNYSNGVQVTTGGRFVNPVGGNANFQYRYVRGTLTNLGQPMPPYDYVSSISGATSYSTNPTVYDTQL